MFTFRDLKAQQKSKVGHIDKKVDDRLKALQQMANKTDIIKLDFLDCGLDDKTFKVVAKTCIELFQKNKAIKVEMLDFSGKNSLTDECTEDLVNFINNIPDSNFMRGTIDVYMSRDPFEAVECAVDVKQKKNGDQFIISLNNRKTNPRP